MAAQFGSMVEADARRPVLRRAGSTARCFAAEGFTGIIDVFESEYGGFCTTFSPSRTVST